jgi:2-desacetyl-2-hydroxyethyl bacteriochlorophyllide A dehydrogenase
MHAAAYAGNGTMVVREADPTPPRPGEVQIEVAYVGLCGTDLHILHGHMDGRLTLPAIIGHEMSGIVSAVGDSASPWEAGDHVTVMPLRWDDTCAACRAGHQHICQNLDFVGIDSPGALQRFWNVPESLLVPLPSRLPLDHAALTEPVAVAVHDVRRSELAAGERAVVIGGGPIGLLIATVARSFGADVTVLEVDDTRRAMAADLGFVVLNPAAEDQSAAIDAWTGGTGADVVFEVSGSAAAVLHATDLVKVRGTLVVVAIHPEPRPLDLKRVFWRELRILGTRVYQRVDFEKAVELLDGGAIPAERMITSIRPLSEVQGAFDALQAGGSMKILIDVREGEGAE